MKNNEIIWLYNNLKGEDAHSVSGMTAFCLINGHNRGVEDSRLRHSGVTLYDNGFTLIELLVVVLIIGLLAAVALPQYQLAVTKARTTTYIPLLSQIADAQNIYYLANGEYAKLIDQLDMDMPSDCTHIDHTNYTGELFKCGDYFLLDNSPSTNAVALNYCPQNNTSWNNCESFRIFRLDIQFDNHPTLPGARKCEPLHNSKLGKKICANMAGFEQ